MNTLKKYWSQLAEKYSSDQSKINQAFDKLLKAYSESHRYYHNTEHIRSMIEEINNCKSIDQDLLLFATWYHDIVYNPKKRDNETKSAEIAVRELRQFVVPEEKIQKVKEFILATANHMNIKAPDANLGFFLDCDLKILGDKREDYLLYAENIRKEYKHVISFIYKMERKKILNRFLESASIYRTEYFRNNYEEQARENISFEIKNL